MKVVRDYIFKRNGAVPVINVSLLSELDLSIDTGETWFSGQYISPDEKTIAVSLYAGNTPTYNLTNAGDFSDYSYIKYGSITGIMYGTAFSNNGYRLHQAKKGISITESVVTTPYQVLPTGTVTEFNYTNGTSARTYCIQFNDNGYLGYAFRENGVDIYELTAPFSFTQGAVLHSTFYPSFYNGADARGGKWLRNGEYILLCGAHTLFLCKADIPFDLRTVNETPLSQYLLGQRIIEGGDDNTLYMLSSKYIRKFNLNITEI